jgi:GDP-mannose 6-dehydrogenase
MPSNRAHLERAVEAVLATKCKKIGVVGLSFKSGTDDLRESPSVQLIKRLLGEGCQVQIWDEDVSLGRLVGFNRHFIEEEIPHIGVLLSTDLEEVVRRAEVLVVGAKALNEETILATLRPDQFVVDLRSLGPVAQPPRKWPVTRCYRPSPPPDRRDGLTSGAITGEAVLHE